MLEFRAPTVVELGTLVAMLIFAGDLRLRFLASGPRTSMTDRKARPTHSGQRRLSERRNPQKFDEWKID